MGNYNKWNRGEADTNPATPIHVVLFVSRNKDNRHLENFQERRNTFVTTQTVEQLQSKFEAFLQNGQPGEMSRMYMSVNPRDNAKTQKALIHQLVDEQYNMATLPQRVAGIAARKENAYGEKQKWLFDFDPVEGEDTEKLIEEFVCDVQHHHEHTRTKNGQTRPHMNIEVHKTVNGYAVVVDQRFDTRELLTKWTNVELKRDDQLCVAWGIKPLEFKNS